MGRSERNTHFSDEFVVSDTSLPPYLHTMSTISRVIAAIITLGERQGSSLPALKKALKTTDATKRFLNAALKKGVEDGTLIKNGGKFKVNAAVKAKANKAAAKPAVRATLLDPNIGLRQQAPLHKPPPGECRGASPSNAPKRALMSCALVGISRGDGLSSSRGSATCCDLSRQKNDPSLHVLRAPGVARTSNNRPYPSQCLCSCGALVEGSLR